MEFRCEFLLRIKVLLLRLNTVFEDYFTVTFSLVNCVFYDIEEFIPLVLKCDHLLRCSC